MTTSSKSFMGNSERLFGLSGADGSDIDNAQQVFEKRSCVGPNKVRDVRQRVPRDSHLPRGVLGSLAHPGGRSPERFSFERDVDQNVGVNESRHSSLIP